MSGPAQKVALPAYLPKRLEAFRIGTGERQGYLLRDKLLNKTYDLEPWQFFVLEVLPGCEEFQKLATVFEDRFAYPLTKELLNDLLASVADNNLIDENAKHPLLEPFRSKAYTSEDGQPKRKSLRSAGHGADARESGKDSSANAGSDTPSEELPPGIQDAVGLDAKATPRLWTLFDPTSLLKLVTPVVAPLRYGIYLLPVMCFAAIFICVEHFQSLRNDVTRLTSETSGILHLLFSMFTANLIVTLTIAFVAYFYRATVSGVGIGLYFGVLPRFVTQVRHVHQLSRRERMWLHAAPLLTRLTLLCLGIFIWYGARDNSTLLPKIGVGLSGICLGDLLLASANPLTKGSVYHLLSAFMNEPRLQGKAYAALLNRIRGNAHKNADDALLAGYALAALVYMFVLATVMLLVLVGALQDLHLGGSTIIIVGTLGAYLLQRTIGRFRKIEAAYERSLQFERWRKRTLPQETDGEDEAPGKSPWGMYARRTLLLALMIAVFLPYTYEPGGNFVIYAAQKQPVATDVAGIVSQVYFDGGETLKKGTVIARLATDDYEDQYKVYTEKMSEQKALVEDLKSRPKPEEVAVAESALAVARTKEAFSKEKLARTENLYRDKAVSFDKLANARREQRVDLAQVSEKRAALELVKAGVTESQIAAAEAKWRSLDEERNSIKAKIDRSVLIMPFDGKLLTLHLKQKTDSYLGKGELFAVVENTGQVTAEVDIPEPDIGYVAASAGVRVRPDSYEEQTFAGTVTTIDGNVTHRPFGNVIKVVARIDNKGGKLKTGVTGYAKIRGPTFPVWKAFSLGLLRFFKVQVWSWIP